ncbi:MAG: hypothetical protein ACRDNO_31355, partial [Trebonia sp.]
VLAAGSPAGALDRPPPPGPHEAFALALCARAGIQDTTRLRAGLGGPLSDALRELAAAVPANDWNSVMGLGRLTEGCAPLSRTHRPPGPAEAAALRAVALSLADGTAVPGTDAPEVLRTVAATVTLVENREKGEAKAGETVILALV